jgi:hypothetical protein
VAADAVVAAADAEAGNKNQKKEIL